MYEGSIIYAREEITSPKRIVTATVALKNASNLNRLPVRTDGALEKQKIASLLNELYKMELSPPIAMGDVVIPNYEDTGVSVVASRSCREEAWESVGL